MEKLAEVKLRLHSKMERVWSEFATIGIKGFLETSRKLEHEF